MLFITFNDLPSGIYKSQVIDVMDYYEQELNIPCTLIAYISLRVYRKNRKQLKIWNPKAIVIPMVPVLKNWRFNRITLMILLRLLNERNIIARGPFAAYLAITSCPKGIRVCYDGRAACYAEAKEYDVFSSASLSEEIFHIEKYVVKNAAYRIAVSTQLINYWRKTFEYSSDLHSVIPCTLGKYFENKIVNENIANQLYNLLGWQKSDIILIYSGSNQKWQSLEITTQILKYFLSQGEHIKILFLTQNDIVVDYFIGAFPKQTRRLWVQPNDVRNLLSIGSYGILFREQSITNTVASPVKFAEYLSAGLKVLCSDNIGDCSSFVVENNCGAILTLQNFTKFKLVNICQEEKNRIVDIAMKNYSKKSLKILQSYQKVFTELKGS